MYSKEETIFFMKQSDRILKIIENQISEYTKDNSDKDGMDYSMTQSDLQGVIEAIVMSIYGAGRKDKIEKKIVINKLKKIQSTIEGDNFTWENINSLIKMLQIYK